MEFSKFRLLLLLFITIFTVLSVSTPSVFAASPNSILVNITPQNPAPNEEVSISLSSFVSNLDSVSISWSVNGKVVSSGIGRKSFILNAPTVGSTATVTANVFLPDGSIEKRIIVKSRTAMILLWQANDSYVPPFYKGKALPTLESEIKIVAMPEVRSGSTLVNPKNMTYSWKKDYTNEVAGSGYGKNFFLYVNDYLESSNNVSVVATTVDQRFSSQATVNIPTTQPKILFYKNNSDVGTVWEKSLASPFTVEKSEIIEAAPYFISPRETYSPRLIWNWSINDRAVNISGFGENFIPLRVEDGTSGTSKLKLQIDNRDKIFQTVSKEIRIQF